MAVKDKTSLAGAITGAALFIAVAVAGIWAGIRKMAPAWDNIRCVLEIIPGCDSTKELPTGYIYDVLKRYAGDNGYRIEITLVHKGHSFSDSLRNGTIDMLAVMFSDSADTGDLLQSDPVDSVASWLLAPGKEKELTHINKWLSTYLCSSAHAADRERFYDVFPYSKKTKSLPHRNISPYDSLLKVYSDSSGIDWHILAAVMYGESRFNIQARSPKGARGLMQLMDKPARKYGVTDFLDPEQNIRAGAMLLAACNRKFRHIEDKNERLHFALAAYNAGEGRVRKYMEHARSLGLDPKKWSEVRQAIPLMDGNSFPQDSLQRATFKGKETYFYVDGIMGLSARFRSIKP